MEDMMTMKEAAAYLRMTPRGLQNRIGKKRTPKSGKVGGRRMFRKSDLDEFIRQGFEGDDE